MSRVALFFGAQTTFTKTGLQLWLEANAGVFSDAGITPAANGQLVQQWNDQSGNAKNATQATSGKRPTFRANVNGSGLPGLQFVGANLGGMTAGGNSDFASQAFTVFAVYQQSNVLSGFKPVLLKGDGSNTSNEVWQVLTYNNSQSPKYITTFSTAYGSTNNSDTVVGGSTLLNLITLKRIDSTHKVMYQNGVQVATGSDSGNSLNAGATALGIGNGTAFALNYDGYIQEILYYSAALSDSDRQAVESYLIQKWGITASAYDLITAPGPFPQHNMNVYVTADAGATFTTPSDVTNPEFTFPGVGGSGTSSDTQAVGAIFYQGAFWCCYEFNVGFVNPTQGAFGIATAPTRHGPWTYVTDVTIFSSPIASAQVWQPQLFFDDDGSVHAIVGAQNNASFDTQMQYYIVDALNTSLTSWSAPTLVTGVAFSTFTNVTDHFLITPSRSPNGLYNIWFHQEFVSFPAGNIGYMSSSSLKSGYTVTAAPASDILGLGPAYNISIAKIGSIWRAFSTIGAVEFTSSYQDSPDWITWTPPTTCTYDNVSQGIVGGGLISPSHL